MKRRRLSSSLPLRFVLAVVTLLFVFIFTNGEDFTIGVIKPVQAQCGGLCGGTCPNGKYCIEATGCVPCQAGKYCVNCAIKTCVLHSTSTAGAAKNSDCTCDAGYGDRSMCGTPAGCGSDKCGICSVCGWWSPAGGNCRKSDAGYYANTSPRTKQDPCPKGRKCPSTGMCNPTQCPCGQYTDATAQTTCKSAPAGRYISGTASQTSGSLAPAGTYTTGGACNPTKCAAGTASSATGATSSATCVSCSCGTYSNSAGSSTCTDAVPGQYVSGTGKNGFILAPAGKYTSTSKACSPSTCACGTYSSSAGSTSCTDAVAGQYVTGTGKTSFTQAPGGGYVSSARACAPSYCPKGTASAAVGAVSSTTCQPCQCGKYASSTGSTSCATAQTGYYASGTGNEGQTVAGAGRYTDTTGACSQKLCPKGTHSTTTGGTSITSCLACPVDYYCDILGMITPKPCPGSTTTRGLTGMSSVEDCSTMTKTISKTRSSSDSETRGSATASFTAPVTESDSESKPSRSPGSPTRSVSDPVTESRPSPTQKSATKTDTGSDRVTPSFSNATETLSFSEPATETPTDEETHSQTVSFSHEATTTMSGEATESESHVATPTASSSFTRQLPYPWAAPPTPLAAASLGTLALGSALLASPVGVRALSILSFTNNLCRPDGYTADAPPPLTFPQSVMPFYKIHSETSQSAVDTDNKHGGVFVTRDSVILRETLPQHRGAVIANTIFGPVIVGAGFFLMQGFILLIFSKKNGSKKQQQDAKTATEQQQQQQQQQQGQNQKKNDASQNVADEEMSFQKKMWIKGVVSARFLQAVGVCIEGAVASSVYILAEPLHDATVDLSFAGFGFIVNLIYVVVAVLAVKNVLQEYDMKYVEAAVKKKVKLVKSAEVDDPRAAALAANGAGAGGGGSFASSPAENNRSFAAAHDAFEQEDQISELIRQQKEEEQHEQSWFWKQVQGPGVWATGKVSASKKSEMDGDMRKSCWPLFAKFGCFLINDESVNPTSCSSSSPTATTAAGGKQHNDDGLSDEDKKIVPTFFSRIRLRVIRFTFFIDIFLTIFLAVVRGLLLSIPCSWHHWVKVAFSAAALALIYLLIFRPHSSNARTLFEIGGAAIVFIAVLLIIMEVDGAAITPILVIGILVATVGSMSCSALTFVRTRILKVELVPKRSMKKKKKNNMMNGDDDDDDDAEGGNHNNNNSNVVNFDLMENFRQTYDNFDDEIEMDLQRLLNIDVANTNNAASSSSFATKRASTQQQGNNSLAVGPTFTDKGKKSAGVRYVSREFEHPLLVHSPALDVWGELDVEDIHDLDRRAGASVSQFDVVGDLNTQMDDDDDDACVVDHSAVVNDAAPPSSVAALAFEEHDAAYLSELERQRRDRELLDQLESEDAERAALQKKMNKDSSSSSLQPTMKSAASLKSRMNDMYQQGGN